MGGSISGKRGKAVNPPRGLDCTAVDDLAHARALCDQLGELFCLTYVKGVDAAEALRRLGGYPATIRTLPAGDVAGPTPRAVALDLAPGRW